MTSTTQGRPTGPILPILPKALSEIAFSMTKSDYCWKGRSSWRQSQSTLAHMLTCPCAAKKRALECSLALPVHSPGQQMQPLTVDGLKLWTGHWEPNVDFFWHWLSYVRPGTGIQKSVSVKIRARPTGRSQQMLNSAEITSAFLKIIFKTLFLFLVFLFFNPYFLPSFLLYSFPFHYSCSVFFFLILFCLFVWLIFFFFWKFWFYVVSAPVQQLTWHG